MNINKYNKLKQLVSSEAAVEFNIRYNTTFGNAEKRLLMMAQLDNMIAAGVESGTLDPQQDDTLN